MQEMPKYGGFTIEVEQDDDRAVVIVAGECDLATADRFDQAVKQARAEGSGRVLLDFSELTFIDSSVIALLVEANADSRRDSGWLRLRGVRGPVRRTLEITGVYEHLPIE